MTYNRRVKRLRAGWDGVCTIEGESGEWQCRVVDISILGIGVTFKHPSPSQLAGRRISVNVPAVARLEGAITHAVPVLGGAVRVGIMFDDPPPPAPAATTVDSTMGDHSTT
jgi:PilZ domain